MTNKREEKPWGYHEIIAEYANCKIKKITVSSGKRLSLQRHTYRSEYWCIIKGDASIDLEGKDVKISTGNSIYIPKGAVHRIKNTGNVDLVFIEIQQGNYPSEDDIERIEDDFGRA